MKSSVASACCLALLVAACVALPVAQPATPQDVELLAQAQETLHTLDLGEPNSDVSARDKRTIGFLRETFPSLTEDSVVSRVARATATATKDQEAEASEPINDQDTASADDADNRDKRFLFGFGGGEGGGSGSAGGSGNFLFDIIRLIAGSGTTEEAADAGTGHSASGGGGGYSESSVASAIGEAPEVGADGIKDDGYTSGIPGPITRLFIIANRGVSNLIQDLILRLAQTSERIVNFKARLITSII